MTFVHIICLVKSVEEFHNQGGISYNPEFSHQMFDSEVIVGYSNPKIDIYYNAYTLQSHYTFTYDSCVDHIDCIINLYILFIVEEIDLLQDSVRECISLGLATDNCTKEEFEDSLSNHPQVELGNIIYEGNCGDSSNDIIQISRSNFQDPKIKKFHERAQRLSFWEIEAASLIELNDPRWEVIYLYNKTADLFIGYITLFHFYTPFKHINNNDNNKPEILRICQALIIPPFQHKGYMKQCFDMLYNIVKEEGAYCEINVESPSDQFTTMRDLYDLSQFFNLINVPNNDVSMIQKEDLDKYYIDFHITKKQIIMLYEVKMLYTIQYKNNNDKALVDKYRHMIKKRIYKEKIDMLRESSRNERVEWLQNEFTYIMNNYNKLLEKLKVILKL